MKSILLYHIFPINHWKEVTELLFQKLPFQRIVVHVSLPDNKEGIKDEVVKYFKKFKVDEILFSINSGKGEVDAMKNFVKTQNIRGYDILTYMHCKGVSKPDNRNISDWTKMMRYFLIEKMNTCKKVFKKQYVTFGVNKSIPNRVDEGFRGCNFFYEGNFVSLNLSKVDLCQAVIQHLEDSYYGLEGFWGKLCTYQEGYSIFNSGINHYLMQIDEKSYDTSYGRLRYSIIKNFYKVKSRLYKSK